MSERRSFAGISLAVLLAAALTACGSDGGTTAATGAAPVATGSRGTSGTSPTAADTTSASPTATVTTTSTVAAGATGTEGGASAEGNSGNGNGTVLCTPTVSRFSVENGVGAGGHFAFSVHVVNASGQPCVTTGYPGVALLDSAGRQVEQAQRSLSGYMGGLSAGATPARLTLQPGQEATTLVEGPDEDQDHQGASCNTSPRLLFTLPDNTDSTTLTHSTPLCGGLQVHPLLAGSRGSTIS